MKEESDIDSFLGGEQISFLSNEIKGLDDFELICFLVVRDEAPLHSVKDEMRLVVAGSRNFKDYDRLAREVDGFIRKLHTDKQVIIVSGTADGADQLGEQYARNHGLQVEEFPAHWDLFGRAAGPKRNMEMAQFADAVIVFWDGKSAGTRNMIECAKAEGLPCKVIEYQD